MRRTKAKPRISVSKWSLNGELTLLLFLIYLTHPIFILYAYKLKNKNYDIEKFAIARLDLFLCT
jgi:hypothetical protein